MKALILAAGLGTRLLSLTADRPKPMLPVGGRPLLVHTIDLLRSHGVRQVAINVHHQPEAITRYFGSGEDFGVQLRYSPEDKLLGTAGAARKLRDFFDEPAFVVYGDVFTDLDLSALAAWHGSHGAALTMALYRVEDPTRAGIVEVDASGRVLRFQEKPRRADVFTDLASAGIFVIEPHVLDLVPDDVAWDFGQDLIPALLARGAPVYGRPADGYVLDIGGLERYRQAEADVRAGRVRLRGSPSPALASTIGPERASRGRD